MSNANSITLEEISCFKLLKKKFVSPQTIARKVPKKFNYSKVTNHPKWDYPFLLFSIVAWNKKRESKHKIKLIKRQSTLIDTGIIHRLLTWMNSGFITGKFAHCLKGWLPSAYFLTLVIWGNFTKWLSFMKLYFSNFP